VIEPTWRKPAGIFGILAIIVLWAALVASLAAFVEIWPVLVQGLFYLVVGIAWIAPLKPLLRWMETGRFRAG
jgi:predicted tellurium resistance membrane protein TerC